MEKKASSEYLNGIVKEAFFDELNKIATCGSTHKQYSNKKSDPMPKSSTMKYRKIPNSKKIIKDKK